MVPEGQKGPDAEVAKLLHEFVELCQELRRGGATGTEPSNTISPPYPEKWRSMTDQLTHFQADTEEAEGQGKASTEVLASPIDCSAGIL